MQAGRSRLGSTVIFFFICRCCLPSSVGWGWPCQPCTPDSICNLTFCERSSLVDPQCRGLFFLVFIHLTFTCCVGMCFRHQSANQRCNGKKIAYYSSPKDMTLGSLLEQERNCWTFRSLSYFSVKWDQWNITHAFMIWISLGPFVNSLFTSLILWIWVFCLF